MAWNRILVAVMSLILSACGSSSKSVELVSPTDANAVSNSIGISVGGATAERKVGSLPSQTTTGSEPSLATTNSSVLAKNDSSVSLNLTSNASNPISLLLMQVVGSEAYFEVAVNSNNEQPAEAVREAKSGVRTTAKASVGLEIELQIPDAIRDGDFCLKIAAQDSAGAVSAAVEVCLTVNSDADGVAPEGSSTILGTWRNTTSENDFLVLAFFDDGTYLHAEIDFDATEEISGMEWGLYSRDQETGDISVSILFDSNGDTGLTDVSEGASKLRLNLSGETLVANFDDDLDGVFEGEMSFDRVADQGLLGTWRNNETENDFLLLAFFDDDTYIHAEVDFEDEEEISGLEWGNYERNPGNGDMNIEILFDGNGDTGFTDFATGNQNLRINTVGDRLNLEVDEDLDGEFEFGVSLTRQ